jgi:hypothetical protein
VIRIKHCVGMMVLGTALLVGCGDTGEPEDAFETRGQGLTKGTPGAQNGDGNFCKDPMNPCGLGEGDCDVSSQCLPGLMCGRDNGARFGFPSGLDICVATHCQDKRVNGDETGLDCGGSCGACPNEVAYPLGSSFHCSNPSFPCDIGQGKCNTSAECVAGLVCARDNGVAFGMASGIDVCVPSHCLDKVMSGDETGLDCGGSCGSCTPLLTNTVSMSANNLHTCAALNDGTSMCWGSNSGGQLGDGSVVSSSAPVAVQGLTLVTQVSAGFEHTCARRSNGSVHCWGLNSTGQLGNNSVVNSSVPVAVAGLTSATQRPAATTTTARAWLMAARAAGVAARTVSWATAPPRGAPRLWR